MNAEYNDYSIVTRADTSDTWETSSSTSTAWGPGALSGRAIKSLGEASLRGLDKLIIRWRLAKIKSDLPSPGSSKNNRDRHGDVPLPNEKLEKIIDDLLELSRLDYYDTKVRHKALRLIMMQIGSRETGQLRECIMKWPREEIEIFLSEMIPCMPLLWHEANASNLNSKSASSSSGSANSNSDINLKARLELISIYRSSQSSEETHEAIPFIDFISQLAQASVDARHAVIDAGALKFLVTLHQHCSIEDENGVDVVEAAKDVLRVFLETRGQSSGDANGDLNVLNQCKAFQMDLVWPRSKESEIIPLGNLSLRLAEFTPTRRKAEWQTLSKTIVFDRLCEIATILSIKSYHHPGCAKDLFDVGFDLLLFCDLHIDDRDIVDLSIFHLLQCIALGGEMAGALQDVLVLSSYDVNLDFFYRIIYPLLRMKVELLSTAQEFRKQVQYYNGSDKNPIVHFVDFAMDVASRSKTCARAILDADIKSLLSTMGRPPADQLMRFHELGSWEEVKHQPTQSRARAGTV